MTTITTSENKKIYFASDQHLGAPSPEASLPREKKFVAWLDTIKEDAGTIFLLGDLFDFWFEYKTVVPKGFVRVLGKLAELKDTGIDIYFFVGNHDLWMRDYFQKELNIPVFHKPQEFDINGKIFLIGHGDGLGIGDAKYKVLKKVFTNKTCQWLFSRLHPNFSFGLANFFSSKSRIANKEKDEIFNTEEEEWLTGYSKKILETKHYDYFVFGHRHLPLKIDLTSSSKYINLGEWLKFYSYGVLENGELELKFYKSKFSKAINE